MKAGKVWKKLIRQQSDSLVEEGMVKQSPINYIGTVVEDKLSNFKGVLSNIINKNSSGMSQSDSLESDESIVTEESSYF